MSQDSQPYIPSDLPEPLPEPFPEPFTEPFTEPCTGHLPGRFPEGTSRDPILIRSEGPRDAIATVWYQLGYRPSNSLVLVGLSGPSRRLGTIARSDLPTAAHRPAAGTRRAIVRGLFEPVAATGTREVLAIVFSDDVFTAGGPAISPALLRSEVRRAGGTVVDVLGVSAGRYRSLECRGPDCCPPRGRPLSEVESSAAAAAHVLLGAEVLPEEADLLRDVQPAIQPPAQSPTQLPAQAQAAVRPAVMAAAPPAVRRRLNPGSRRLQWLVWERAFEVGEIAPGRAASLAPYLDDPYLRDAVLVGSLGGDRELVLESLRHTGPEGALDLFALVTRSPEEADQKARVERARVVFATAARFAAPGERGGALAVLALIAWYLGQAARARLLVQSALADQPGQSLAVLVDDMLRAAVPPLWLPDAFARRVET